MNKLICTCVLLLLSLSLYAQRGSRGQHTLSVGCGYNLSSEHAYSLQVNYGNYRKSGTLDLEFSYNAFELGYNGIHVPICNYMLSAGYHHCIVSNYTRTLMFYVGASAAIGYTQANNGDKPLEYGISLSKTNEVPCAIIPGARLDCFVDKRFGLTLKIEDMIYIKSSLCNTHNALISLGFKYIIQ